MPRLTACCLERLALWCWQSCIMTIILAHGEVWSTCTAPSNDLQVLCCQCSNSISTPPQRAPTTRSLRVSVESAPALHPVVHHYSHTAGSPVSTHLARLSGILAVDYGGVACVAPDLHFEGFLWRSSTLRRKQPYSCIEGAHSIPARAFCTRGPRKG